MGKRLTLFSLACVMSLGAAAADAQAAPIAGLTPAGELVLLDSADPGTILARHPITGLQPSEHVRGIDVRPETGQLYALGIVSGLSDTGRIYVVDPGTGAATPVGTEPFSTTLRPGDYGFDFNPFSDRLRVVNQATENLRVNADDGTLLNQDSDLAPNGLDAIAYDQNLAGVPQTTLWGYDSGNDQVVRVGEVDGTGSQSASNGQVHALPGPSGFDIQGPVGMDIAPGGTAFLSAATATSVYSLYQVDLGGGTLSKVGDFPEPVDDIARLQGSSFAIDDRTVTVTEDAGTATVTVLRFGNDSSTQTVAYATSDGDADGSDYVAVTGTLTFGPGDTSKTFEVPITGDLADEPTEFLNFALSSPAAGSTLTAPSAGTVVIVDDDGAPDTSKPRLLLAISSSRSLRKMLHGLPGRVSVSETSRVVLRLRLGNRTIGIRRLNASGPTVRRFRVLLLARGRHALQRRLRTRRSTRLKLLAAATDPAGNVGRTSAKILIRR